MSEDGNKRVLFLTEHDPFDVSYGGGQRTHFIWCALKQKYPCLETVIPVPTVSKEMFDADNNIRRICFEKRYSIRWLLVRVWLRIFKRLRWPGLIPLKRLFEVYPTGFDLVVVRYPGLAAFYAAWKIAPMILDVDDVPTQSFETNWCGQKGLLFRFYLKCMKTWQTYVFKKAKILWIVNNENRTLVPKNKQVYLVQNIPRFDHPVYSNYISREKYVFYLGCLAGQLEDVGIDYMLNHYWSEIHRSFPELIFKIAGSLLPRKFQEKWARIPNVEVLGFVEDIHSLYKESRAMLAPISAGAGTAIKVLECLSYGRVCIGTPFAWRGYEFSSLAMMKYENLEELMGGIALIMDNNQLPRLQEMAVRVVEDHCSYAQFQDSLYKSLNVIDEN